MKRLLLILSVLISTQVLAGSTPPIGGRINSVGTPLNYDNNSGALTMGTVPVNQGGTGQTTSSAGLNALLPSQTGNSGKALVTDGSNASWGTAASGSVTSVSLALPSDVFSISGSPVTSSGTLTGSFNTQAAHACFMGPVGGSPNTPSFRSLVASDIPALNYEPTLGYTPLNKAGDTMSGTLNMGGNSVTNVLSLSNSTSAFNFNSNGSGTVSTGALGWDTAGNLGTSNWTLYQTGAFNNSGNALNWDSSGNLTSKTLQVNGSATVGYPGYDQNFYFGGTNAGIYWASSGASLKYSVGSLDFSAVGAPDSLYLQQTTGYLGVGLTSPNYRLDVNGAGNFNSNPIHSVSDPTLAQDASTKNYADTHVAGTLASSLSGILKASTGVISGSATTTDLPEGSNLYYTQARFDSAFSAKTTSNLTEGSNLYFTNARAQAAVTASLSPQEFYVTQTNGSDTNSGSLLAPFKTIGAGITACNAVAAYYKQCIVHVAPSTGGTGSAYNENVTFSQQGVNLICDAPQQNTRACLISGTVTVNLTGTSGGANFNAASNEVYMTGFIVSATTTNNALVFTGTTYQRFLSLNNYFDQNGSVSSLSMDNSGTSGSTPSTLVAYDTTFANGNATNPTVTLSAGRFWNYGTQGTISNSNASGPSVTQSGSTSSAIYNLVQLTGQYNLTSNTATATFNLSTIASGANPCIVTPSSASTGYALLAYFGCNSTATNSITGSGVVVNSPGNIRLNTSGDIISTVTQSSFPGLPQGSVLIGNKAPSATNVLLSVFDGHIKASQTTAATAAVNANAGTSATCTLTNGRDHSGVINLTTGSAASGASGTQCTVTFNKAFATAPNCVLSPRNALAASKLVSQQIFNTTTTTTLVLSFGAADTAANAMQFWYSCLEP